MTQVYKNNIIVLHLYKCNSKIIKGKFMEDEKDIFEEFIENYPSVNDKVMTELQVIADIRLVLTGYYNAKIYYDEEGLKIKFKNGQIFIITVKEKK